MKSSFKFLAVLLTLTASAAQADTYLGGLVGYGITSGSAASLDGGLALGATAGFQLVPTLGLGVTYIHDAFKSGSIDVGVNQFLAEANFFSLLFFPSGVHIGSVSTSVGGSSSSDLGFGAHTGFDLMIIRNMSIGASVYWTYVLTTNDKHSLFNLLVPIKFHF